MQSDLVGLDDGGILQPIERHGGSGIGERASNGMIVTTAGDEIRSDPIERREEGGRGRLPGMEARMEARIK